MCCREREKWETGSCELKGWEEGGREIRGWGAPFPLDAAGKGLQGTSPQALKARGGHKGQSGAPSVQCPCQGGRPSLSSAWRAELEQDSDFKDLREPAVAVVMALTYRLQRHLAEPLALGTEMAGRTMEKLNFLSLACQPGDSSQDAGNPRGCTRCSDLWLEECKAQGIRRQYPGLPTPPYSHWLPLFPSLLALDPQNPL